MSHMLDEKTLFVKNATDYLLGQVTSSTTYGAPFFEIRQAGGRQGGCSSRPHVNKTVKRLKRIDICCGGTAFEGLPTALFQLQAHNRLESER